MYPKTEKELKPASTLREGHIARLSGNRYRVVKKSKKGKKEWKKATKKDRACDRYLKNKIGEYMGDVKRGKSKKIKTKKQALAAAYSKTGKKYPQCKLIKKKNKK